MTKSQRLFEAIMRVKGHSDFTMSATGKYLNPSLQQRWAYFAMGWEMKEATT